jgi:hypothetical protein
MLSLSLDPLVFPIAEKATGTYTATLVGNDGVTPIPFAALLTLTLTLYVIKQDGTDSLIRNHQNVLNVNNVTVDATSGLLTWVIQTTDTTLIEAVPVERHIALFEWTTAAIAGKHEVVLAVKNLRQVT